MPKIQSRLATVVVTAAVTASICAGIAFAYDAKLDLAEDSIVKGTAQLQASVVPDVAGQRCQKYVDKAIGFLDKSMLSIEKAKTCAGA